MLALERELDGLRRGGRAGADGAHQKFLRTRRTNRSLTRFRTSVKTNSRKPDQVERLVGVERLTGDGSHLVGPDRERRDGARHRLARTEEVEVRSDPPVPPAAIATTIVSPIAREIPRITAAAMPGCGGGEHDLRRHAPTTRADPVRRLAERAGDGVHRVLRDGRHERHRQDADADAGSQQAERACAREELLHEVGADDAEGEEPHDDARHAGKRLEDGLQDPSEASG